MAAFPQAYAQLLWKRLKTLTFFAFALSGQTLFPVLNILVEPLEHFGEYRKDGLPGAVPVAFVRQIDKTSHRSFGPFLI